MYNIRKSSLLAATTFILFSGMSVVPNIASAHTDLVCATQCYHGGGGTTQQCAAKCVGHTHGSGGTTEPASDDKTTDSGDPEESKPARGLISYKKLPQ